IQPAMPLYGVIIALTFIGFGAGTVYPVATVSIQNAVPAHQVGTATGTMNFFRALASTLAVAIMGAILLAALGAAPERGTSVQLFCCNVKGARLLIGFSCFCLFLFVLFFSGPGRWAGCCHGKGAPCAAPRLQGPLSRQIPRRRRRSDAPRTCRSFAKSSRMCG